MNISRKKVTKDNGEEYTNKFSVLSYNILAECNLIPCRNELYHYVTDEYLLYDKGVNSNRLALTIKEMNHFNSDILMLQEVDESCMNIIFSQLSNIGYESIFYQKVGILEGCSICYKRDKFVCLETVRFFMHDEIARIGNEVDMPEEFINQLTEPHVALITVLKDTTTEKVVVCATSHIVYEELAEPALQALQACLVCQKINEVRTKLSSKLGVNPNDISVVFGGDFNGEPHHMVIQLMKNQKLTASQMKTLETLTYSLKDRTAEPMEFYEVNHISKYLACYLENPLKLLSSYFQVKGKEPTITTSEGNFAGIADYIFHTSDLKVCSIVDIDSSVYEAFKNGGPSKDFPSDHLPLVAEFAY